MLYYAAKSQRRCHYHHLSLRGNKKCLIIWIIKHFYYAFSVEEDNSSSPSGEDLPSKESVAKAMTSSPTIWMGTPRVLAVAIDCQASHLPVQIWKAYPMQQKSTQSMSNRLGKKTETCIATCQRDRRMLTPRQLVVASFTLFTRIINLCIITLLLFL